MSDACLVPGFSAKAWTAGHPTWTDRRRRSLREKRDRWHASRGAVERKPELPSLLDDGSELFNRSP